LVFHPSCPYVTLTVRESGERRGSEEGKGEVRRRSKKHKKEGSRREMGRGRSED
jgi:hypothetical protein